MISHSYSVTDVYLMWFPSAADYDLWKKYVPQPVEVKQDSVYDYYDILEELGRYAHCNNNKFLQPLSMHLLWLQCLFIWLVEISKDCEVILFHGHETL